MSPSAAAGDGSHLPSQGVSVCIRLRPFLPRESPPAVVQVSGNGVYIQVPEHERVQPRERRAAPASEAELRQFAFDLCLGAGASQEHLYAQVGDPILRNALAGFNGTLFAYGQTGSGKSFSMMGPESDPGIIPRLFEALFQPLEEPPSELRVSVSFLEIYNEEIKDLLDPRPRQKKLYVHQHPKLGVHVPHLTEAAAPNAAECQRLLQFGLKIRATAQTNMNSTSSRSHSVLTLRVTQVFPGKIRNSSVNLCDLAGSERAKKTGAMGQRMREGQNINSSLSVLGQVISKLAAGAEKRGAHLPFRQSKLTHLLTDALSGNSVTTMLANVSPAASEAEESLSSLRFAESVKKVKTRPKVMDLAPEEPAKWLETLGEEIDVLKSALAQQVTCNPNELTRAIEACSDLQQTISRRSGAEWSEALAQGKALEALQQRLLEQMSLPVEEVSHIAGVGVGTPYLLNVSDDPALSGMLLYFLRPEPAASTVGQAGPDSIAPNSIVLQGCGIPARLAEVRYRQEPQAVRIRCICTEDSPYRLLVNGRPVGPGRELALHHGDRIVFGWAFCFRLVMPGEPKAVDQGQPEELFKQVQTEVLEYSLTTSMDGIGVMRAAAQWQAELRRRGLDEDEMETCMALIGHASVQVEEANMLCHEVHKAMPSMQPVSMDIGMCFSFVAYGRRPSVVVQVWRTGVDPRLLVAWPATDFERRLVVLRDAHREVLRSGGVAEQGLAGAARWAWRLSRDAWWACPVTSNEDDAEAFGAAADASTELASVLQSSAASVAQSI